MIDSDLSTDLRRPCTPPHPAKSAPHHPTPGNPHPTTAISWGPRDRDFAGTPGSRGPASAVLAHPSTDGLARVGAGPRSGAPGPKIPAFSWWRGVPAGDMGTGHRISRRQSESII